jgi:hypothetical protein
MKAAINDWKFVLLACLTLGLAPFLPTPHIWSKLYWIARGAKGFDWADLLDLFVHTLPWLLLARLVLLTLQKHLKK